MAVEGFAKFSKFILILFTFISFIIGIATIALGGTFLEALRDWDLPETTLYYILIPTGGFIILISFFGCCGSIKENTCMLKTFMIFLCLAAVLQFIAGGIGMGLSSEKLETSLRKELKPMFEGFAKNYPSVDELQFKHQCCGLDGPQFYFENNIEDIPQFHTPKSCCNYNDPNALGPNQPCKEWNWQNNRDSIMKYDVPGDQVYQIGCIQAISEQLNIAGSVVGVSAFICGAFTICCLLFACCLIRGIRKTALFV